MRFDIPGANPQTYFDQAQSLGSIEITGTINDTPIKSKLYQYEVAGSSGFYLEMASLPQTIMGKQSEGIILPDLLQGKPLVPVCVDWRKDASCRLELADGVFSHGKEINQNYQIIAKINAGPVEYSLGELDGKFPFFVTWERTPANDRDGPPNYYWGHYFDNRDDAVEDFCRRAEEKYQSLEKSRKPSIKAQLAAKPVPGDQPAKPKEREVR